MCNNNNKNVNSKISKKDTKYLCIDEVVKSKFSSSLSFLQKQESRIPGENRDPVFEMVPDLRRDDVWTPAGVYPVVERGRSDGFLTFYGSINHLTS